MTAAADPVMGMRGWVVWYRKRVWSLLRPHRRMVIVPVLITVTSTFLAMLSPFLLRATVDNALLKHNSRLLVYLCSGMIAIALTTAVLSVATSWFVNKISQRVLHDLRSQLFVHMQRLPLMHFTENGVGDRISRIANDVGAIDTALTITVTSAASSITSFLGGVGAMIYLAPMIALVLLPLLPIYWYMSSRAARSGRNIVRQRQETFARLTGTAARSLSLAGILLSRTLGCELKMATQFISESEELGALEVRQRMVGRWLRAATGIFFAVMPASIYLIGGLEFSARGSYSIGTLVAVATVMVRLSSPVTGLVYRSVQIRMMRTVIDRIFGYLELEIDENCQIDPKRPGLELDTPTPTLDVQDVSFRYADSLPWAIHSVSFTVKPGERVAIVGKSGAGKSTLAYVVAGLYPAQHGQVELGGRPLSALSMTARQDAIGFMAQDTYLVQTSIAENLRLARPDASLDELREACTLAGISQLIESLPQGYETVVGDSGVRFSGGERQRIAVARIVLRDPAIWILDEPTSALDMETEAGVIDSIDLASRGRAMIMITHSPPMIERADRVLVMDKGAVSERRLNMAVSAASHEMS